MDRVNFVVMDFIKWYSDSYIAQKDPLVWFGILVALIAVLIAFRAIRELRRLSGSSIERVVERLEAFDIRIKGMESKLDVLISKEKGISGSVLAKALEKDVREEITATSELEISEEKDSDWDDLDSILKKKLK